MITSWRMLSRMVFWVTCSSCWVEMTTVWMRWTLSPSNSTVTWDFPSGRNQGNWPFLRTSASFRVSRWAKWMGAGINSGVSLQA